MSIVHRFNGEDGRRRLIEEITNQTVVRGNKNLAESIASVGSLIVVKAGDELIAQGGSDNDIFFILSGKFDILVNRRLIATRSPGQHVGEMAMIDSSSSRSASVVASTDSVALKVTEDGFTALADKNPDMWRLIAKDLSSRLRERSRFIKEPNLHPHVFIGCSSEYLAAGVALQEHIASPNLTVRLWTDGIFHLSASTLNSLYVVSQQVDFGVLILGPDDKLESRENFYTSPRDNIVFELGLFMGGVAPERTIFIAPKITDFKIPSDLNGITHIKVECNPAAREIPADELKRASSEILAHIGKLGVK